MKIANPHYSGPSSVTPNQAAKILIVKALNDYAHIYDYQEDYDLTPAQYEELIRHYQKHVNSIKKRFGLESIL